MAEFLYDCLRAATFIICGTIFLAALREAIGCLQTGRHDRAIELTFVALFAGLALNWAI